jgi:uncharacterized protein (DUF849 family)
VFFDYESKTLATNAMHVRRMKNIILAMGLEVATPSEARMMLSLPPK